MMKKYVAAIVLVALGAFGLSLFAQDQTTAPAVVKPDRPAFQGPLARAKDALKLTPDQEARLKEFHKARQADNKAFTEQMKKLRSDMQALRQDDKADPNKVNGLIDQMFKLQADRAKAQFKNRKDLEKIFTPEQLQKMKNGRSMFMGLGRMGGFMPGPRGGMGFGRGMMMRGPMMRGPMMRFGMRLKMMMRNMLRFGRRGLHFRPGMQMMRHHGARGPAHSKDKTPEPKSPEVKK
jgi:Spy/CpxP family protein refolding chaperone